MLHLVVAPATESAGSDADLWITLAIGAAVGGAVGYRIGNLVGAFRAARSSWRTVRGRR